jgi:predicted alpha/beta hydrolase family esterase
MFKSTVLLVPGLGNSNEEHWQSYWEKNYLCRRVQQKEWNYPDCQEWVETLDKTVMEYNARNVILAGHSLACATIARWAEAYNRNIKAAMLVAPADTEAPGFPAVTTGFTPMSTQKLRFPSIVVASTNDEYVTISRAQYFAGRWGSEFINIGAAGHINALSGFTKWPEGLQLLRKLEIAL